MKRSHQLQHAAELRLVVDADGRILLGEQVAQELGDEALLAVEHGRARLRLRVSAAPRSRRGRSSSRSLMMSSSGRPAAAVRMMTPPVKPCCSRNSRTMPRSRRALFARLDLPGDADVVDGRHEDQEAARHRDVRRDAGALGAERLLDDLDEDLLPFFEEVFDLRVVPPTRGSRSRPSPAVPPSSTAAPRRPASRRLVARLEPFELLERRGLR